MSDEVDVTLLALQTALNEVSRDEDSQILGAYGEVGFAIGPHRLQVSVADYGFRNVDQVAVGRATGPLRSTLTNEGERDAAGNVVGLVSDFNLVDTIVQAEFNTGREAYPLRLLGQFLRNTRAASDLDTGMWFEAEYGGSNQTRAYTLGYTYAQTQQEAALSPFVFSDMPGTDSELHMVTIAYVPIPNLTLDVTTHFTRELDIAPGACNPWRTRAHVAAIVRF